MNDKSTQNEKIIWRGKPHIGGFLWFYGLLLYWVFLVLWGSQYIKNASYNATNTEWFIELNVLTAWFGLVLFPLLFLTLKKIQLRWLFIGLAYIVISLLFKNYTEVQYPFRFGLVVFIIVGLIWIEFHRQCFFYTVGEKALMIEVTGFKRWIRLIPYHSISDLVLEQGILGKILNVGTIIPVTNSGFGLGSDGVIGGGQIGISLFKRLFGGLLLGGIRTQYRPRSEPQFVLYGVKNPREVVNYVYEAQGIEK